MAANILRTGTVAILIAICSQGVVHVTSNDSIPFNMDEWLQYKKHRDFSWNVSVSKPTLTLQQRFLVTVSASIRGNDLPSSEKAYDLYFVLKVADEGNVWTPGYSNTRLAVPPRPGKYHYINAVAGVYLRPGRYTLALIVYDSVTKKGNVQQKKIKVPRPKGNVLPDLDRTLNDVEFTTEVPLKSNTRYSYRGKMSVLAYEPLAAGIEWLPVKTNRRICLDIVANISPGVTYTEAKEFGRSYANPFSILQVASVLSHLGLEHGSIHVSILDALGAKTYFYREDAANLDWRQTGQALLFQGEPDTVDYGELQAQTEASAYLVDTLHKIMDEGSGRPDSESPLKIVLVVSGDLEFAERTPLHQIIPPELRKNPAPVKIFHFRIRNYYGSDNDLDKMLEPANPIKFTFTEACDFRKALADFISRLEEF